MKTIGLTGRSGAGKSFAHHLLHTHFNLTLIDLDSLGHVLLEEPKIKDRLITQFGRTILTPKQEIDRPALGKIVFSDPDALATLNAIVHPQMKEEIITLIALSDHHVVIEGALLSEIKLIDLCDTIVTLYRDEGTVIKGSKESHILKNQRTLEEYKQEADILIFNDKTSAFEEKIIQTFRYLLGVSR